MMNNKVEVYTKRLIEDHPCFRFDRFDKINAQGRQDVPFMVYKVDPIPETRLANIFNLWCALKDAGLDVYLFRLIDDDVIAGYVGMEEIFTLNLSTQEDEDVLIVKSEYIMLETGLYFRFSSSSIKSGEDTIRRYIRSKTLAGGLGGKV